MGKQYRKKARRGEGLPTLGGHTMGAMHQEILKHSDEGMGGSVLLPNRFRTKKR